ncbi:alpha/beta hydrolase fold domain-containing protein [Streptomyces sp. NPDC002577]
MSGQAVARTPLLDLAYAPPDVPGGAGRLLDLHLPPGPGPFPVVLWSHGSGWLADNGRDGTDEVAAQLVPRGIAVAGVAVRSSDHARFPGQLHDLAAAVRYLAGPAAVRHGLDPGRFAVMGESSGGWLALMAAFTGAGRAGAPRAAVAFYPPTDLLSMDAQAPPVAGRALARWSGGRFSSHADPSSPESRLLGGPLTTLPDLARRASPLHRLGPDSPPVLLLHGERDPLVPYGQSLSLLRAARRHRRQVDLVGLPRGGHGQWRSFLAGSGAADGARRYSSLDGAADDGRPVEPTWAVVAAFLHDAFSR